MNPKNSGNNRKSPKGRKLSKPNFVNPNPMRFGMNRSPSGNNLTYKNRKVNGVTVALPFEKGDSRYKHVKVYQV